MKSKNFVIPACLVTTREQFVKRLDFAQTVGNSFHIDVIDPDFVTGETLKIENWPLIDIEYAEAHLMVKSPVAYLAPLKIKGIMRALVHIEAEFDLEELATEARVNDILLGFAVNPDTDLTALRKYFAISNYIQVMGVMPGRVGQPQLPQTALAVSYLHKLPYRLTITVDGGVNSDNIAEMRSSGADNTICSAALYQQGEWLENYQALLEKAKNVD
jgi:ribulose-phosphate 3-epimerase